MSSIFFSIQEIADSIDVLSSGRSAGNDGLSAEHFKFAGASCKIPLSLCFSMMALHSYLPSSLSKVVLTPIVKDMTATLTDINNYRPIAVASVFVRSVFLQTLEKVF